MKKLFLYCIIAVSLATYFSLTLFVLPPNFLEKPKLVPQPTFDVTLEKSKINLGESFEIKITSNNIGDPADIQIISIQFPTLQEIDDVAKIIEYDFTQSPHYVLVGDEVGAEYTAGQKIVSAKYPSIEAFSRPINTGDQYKIGLQITPKTSGTFIIHIKSVILPHYTDLAHYPQSGQLDYQGEYVEVYSVEVSNP
jgi:hypothetical protein